MLMALSTFGFLCPGSLLLVSIGIDQLGPATFVRGSSTVSLSGNLHGGAPSPILVGGYLVVLVAFFAFGFALWHRNQP